MDWSSQNVNGGFIYKAIIASLNILGDCEWFTGAFPLGFEALFFSSHRDHYTYHLKDCRLGFWFLLIPFFLFFMEVGFESFVFSSHGDHYTYHFKDCRLIFLCLLIPFFFFFMEAGQTRLKIYPFITFSSLRNGHTRPF
jgi:uncharacterized membrane protein